MGNFKIEIDGILVVAPEGVNLSTVRHHVKEELRDWKSIGKKPSYIEITSDKKYTRVVSKE